MPSPEMVRQRAAEIARSDGRERWTRKDWLEARSELLRSTPRTAVESDEDSVAATRQPFEEPGTTGERAPKMRPAQDEDTRTDLVEEGISEADRDERISAGEETRREAEEIAPEDVEHERKRRAA